jgi:DNA mismatch repair protein MutS
VLFLRRVVEQPASRSYGIEVARLAGLPETIIGRAREILTNLEQGELDEAGLARIAHHRDERTAAAQMSLFTRDEDRALDEIRALDVERMTPLDAFAKLAEITSRLRRPGS